MTITVTRTDKGRTFKLGENTALAIATAAEAKQARDETLDARDVTLAGLDGPFYTAIADGELATAQGAQFTVKTGPGVFQVRERTAAGSSEVITYYGQPAGFILDTSNGFPVSVPYYTANTDLLVVTGQSNAAGRGTTNGPDAPAGFEINGDTGAIIALADPLGDSTFGSAWPAFVNEYAERSGNAVAVVMAAVGSTSLLPEVGTAQDWSPTGTLRADAVAKAQTAITALEDSPAHRLGRVIFAWAQGEGESENINGTTITGANYRDALVALADYFKAQVPRMEQIYVTRTGRRKDQTLMEGYAEIRHAQEEACAQSTLLTMAYRGTASFTFDGQDLMNDSVHYDTPGLNIMGRANAIAAVNGSPVVPTAPAVLATAAFDDTDAGSANSTRTDSHTTAAGAKMLVVAVSGVRVGSSASNSITSVTFNGVALEQLNVDTTGQADNGSPSSRANVAMFGLSDTAYRAATGNALGGATADIVVTASTSMNILTACALDVDTECWQVFGQSETDTSNANTATDLSTTLVASGPHLLIAIAASAADGAAALTHSFTGFTAKVQDTGGDNGSGRVGQAAVAHGTISEPVAAPWSESRSVTLSGPASAFIFYCVGLRARLPGEA